jgi:adenine phosphoribosyltransferase
MDLAGLIRDVPDFPTKGVLFKDITTLLQNPEGLRQAFDRLAEPFTRDDQIDAVVAIESRGFIFGAHLAYQLGAALVPVRKPGKLPSHTIGTEYSLEYGTNRLEMHKDAIQPGQRVLIVDDVLATGGSAGASIRLVEELGGTVVALAFLVELSFLRGSEALDGYRVYSVIKY